MKLARISKFLPVFFFYVIFLMSSRLAAQPVPGYAGWDVSPQQGGDDGSYQLQVVYSLRPPDGRPAVSIVESIAKQVLSGSMSPEVAYGSATGVLGQNASSPEDDNVYKIRPVIEVAPDTSAVLASADGSAAAGQSNISGVTVDPITGLPIQAADAAQTVASVASQDLSKGGASGANHNATGGGGKAMAHGYGGGKSENGNGSSKGLGGYGANGGKKQTVAYQDTKGATASKDSAHYYGQRSLAGDNSSFMKGVNASMNTSFGVGAAGVASAGGKYFNPNMINEKPPDCVSSPFHTLCQGNTGQGNNFLK